MSPIIKLEPQSPPEGGEETVVVSSPPSTSNANASTVVLDADSSHSHVYKSGEVARLDVPLPFFIKNDVFDRFGEVDYSWEGKEEMVLLLKHRGGGDSVIMKKKIQKEQVEYSIGGCPLECPFDLNEDFDEALVIDSVPTVFNALKIPSKYSPLPVNDACWAVRQAIIQKQPFVGDLNLVEGTAGWPAPETPVFAFVDGSEQNNPLTLAGFKGTYNQGINVKVIGRFRPDAQELSMETFRRYHEVNVLTFDNRPTTTVGHAVYEKLHGESPSRGKVYMEFMFKEPTSTNIFGSPPKDSKSKIAIRPLPGDANPSMRLLWSEIEDLEKWIKILAKCSEAGAGSADMTSFLNSTAYDISEDRLTENSKAVQELLAKEPSVDFYGASCTEISDSLDSLLQRVVMQERADCDFTDRIWSVVRKCESVEELQDCLQLVFQAVSNKMYRPYLLLTNTTTMASSLAKVMKGEITSLLQLRQHRTMVQVVIECGLQKLFKDFNFVLAMSHLIERGEIASFTPSISNISASLTKLKQLHCILEIMCLSKERLMLSVNIQAGHVKKMLARFSEQSSEEFNWDQTYHFDVLTNDIHRSMSGLHPFYFKIKMHSKTLLKWTTTTVVVSTEQYINHKRTASDDIHSRLYYLYVICQSARLEK